MQIQSANVRLSTDHQFERSQRQITATVEQGRLVDTPALPAGPTLNLTPIQYKVSMQPTVASRDMETSLLKGLVEAMTGKKIATQSINRNINDVQTTIAGQTLRDVALDQSAAQVQRRTHQLTLVREYEYSQVTINATLNDKNNHQFNIHLNVVMERRYEEIGIDVLRQEGVITDPLVINFNAETAALSPTLVEFDLNSDGTNELIPSLSSNSAYIALDRNNDGIINNGSELFGPTTSNGFNELSQYDDDHNGFIDSNDKIFSQLLAFNPGTDELLTLDSLGVDVLYLGSIDSPFRLTDHNNQTLGEIRATGFYVNKNGQAGSLQQVDLMV